MYISPYMQKTHTQHWTFSCCTSLKPSGRNRTEWRRLASTAPFYPLFRTRLKHDSPVCLGSTPDNRPTGASWPLALVPGPRSYNCSDSTEGAMFGVRQKSQRWHCGGYAMRDSISWVGSAKWFEWDHTGFANEGRFASFRIVSPQAVRRNLQKL